MTAATFTAFRMMPHAVSANTPAPQLGLVQEIRPGRAAFVLEVTSLSLAALWASVLVCSVLSGAF